MILRPEIKELSVRAEAEPGGSARVLLLQEGRLVVAMPIPAAKALIKALQIKTLQAEEHRDREQIAYDQAVLLRSGVALGLSARQDIQHEARQLAAWDSDLRRYIQKKRHIDRMGKPSVIGGT